MFPLLYTSHTHNTVYSILFSHCVLHKSFLLYIAETLSRVQNEKNQIVNGKYSKEKKRNFMSLLKGFFFYHIRKYIQVFPY